jgi:hypothetical protein
VDSYKSLVDVDPIDDVPPGRSAVEAAQQSADGDAYPTPIRVREDSGPRIAARYWSLVIWIWSTQICASAQESVPESN